MIRDLKQAARRLGQRPGSTVVAVLALGLGIGFSVAIFSILAGSLWQDLPVREPENLMAVAWRGREGDGVSPAVFSAWSQGQTRFRQLVAWLSAEQVLSGDGRPAESLRGAYVSGQFFDAVAAHPSLGRGLLPEEDRENAFPALVLGHALWVRRYNADPRILGREVRLGGESRRIVGVMPRGFRFPVDHDYWLPLGNVLPSLAAREIPVEVFGRLDPSTRPEIARAELEALAPGALRPSAAGPSGQAQLAVDPFIEAATRAARAPLRLLAGAVAGVLLIACANVAGLLLARVALRERELAIRAALGAGWKGLTWPILAESFWLSCLGGVTGLLVAWLSLRLYNASGGLVHAFWVDVRLSGGALLFTLGLTLAVALASGLIPALRAARPRIGQTFKGAPLGTSSPVAGTRGRILVALQIALSCALLTGTAQMVQSVRSLDRQDFGRSPEEVWTALLMPAADRFPDPPSWERLYGELSRAIAAAPGVQAVALTSHLPATPTPRTGVETGGSGPSIREDARTARWSVVSPGFFTALGRPILQGRDFSAADGPAAPAVVLVNQSLVVRDFLGASPVGKRLRLADPKFQGRWFTIVGVVPDLFLSWDYRSDRMDLDHLEGVYLPLAQRPQPGVFLLVRSRLAPSALGREVRQVLERLDPELPPLQTQTLEERIAAATIDYRMLRLLLSVFSGAALLLAGVGLYGLVALAAGRRRREIATRFALGAQGGQVVALVLRGAAVELGVGATVGALLSFSTARLLRSLLFGVAPGSLVPLASALGLLLLAGGAACVGPTLRSLRLDPARALGSE